MKEVSEYWISFEKFNQKFVNSNRLEISKSLENARSYVNGMTDGWYEFLIRLKETRSSYESSLSVTEKSSLDKMITELERNLSR